MSVSRESVVVIPGVVPLHAVVHSCLEGHHPHWGLVFCNPFAEEQKCAHRVLVEAARGFCEADIACLRFDYRGTGDSPGSFAEATPEQWVEDILAAAKYLREMFGVTTLGLLGVRLGGALALHAAEVGEGIDYLVLWEPVINGRQYLQQNLRRSLIKAMLTDKDQFDAGKVRSSHEQEMYDFDGYPVSQEMRRQIEAMDLLGTAPQFNGPSLVLNIGPREQPAEPYQQLAEALHGRVAAVRQEPFWNRIGLIEAQPAVEATEIWLAEQQASWLPDHRA